MDAKTFGAFLARMRKSQGLTQAELAQQLHVTDKAVSRWERGVGLPDINTLEPLADALGLTLADLMHCRDPQEADIAPEVPLEDFFTLLRRQQSIDWRSVRAVLFWLSAALAIWGILACPGRISSPCSSRWSAWGHPRLPGPDGRPLAYPEQWEPAGRRLASLLGVFPIVRRDRISLVGALEQL